MKILQLTSVLLMTFPLILAHAQDEAAPPVDESVPAPAVPPAGRGGGANTFASLDSNSDGSVTKEEFTASFVAGGNGGRTPQPDRVFGRWDADSDGVITAEEFDNRPRRQQGQGQGQGQPRGEPQQTE